MKRENNSRLQYQIIFIIIAILVIPLSVIGFYFYSSTVNSMEAIGKERGIASLHTAQSLIQSLGENLLSIASSNSRWEEYRQAIEQRDISWIKQNVDSNLSSVPNLDFIVTTDQQGNLLSMDEKEKGITQDLNYPIIMKQLKQAKDYSGLVNTSKGLAIISVSEVTNEDGNAPTTGNLIFGRLLDQKSFQYIKDTLQLNLGIVTISKQMFSSADDITMENLQPYLEKMNAGSISYETSITNGTIIVRASQSILDIDNKPIGVIYLEYPLITSTNVMKNLKQMLTLNGIIIISLLVILTFVLQRRILIPLKHFTTTLEQVASGSSVNEIPSKILVHAEDNILVLFDRLHKLSYYDYLTELPNRRYCSKHLEQTLKEAQNNQQKVAIMYLDLDRFKNINDSLGHSTGDRLLQLVASRLRNCISDKGFVARLGGDEFAIILPQLQRIEEVEQLALEITSSFSDPFLVDDYDLFVTSSIGISIFPDDGDSIEVLFMNADAAMYRAKEQGRNKYQYYSSSMNSTMYNKLKLETMLRKAIEKNELFLVYQPKVSVETNEIVGMEALIRWLHPELGVISPDDFIPIAEETGLILSIGDWVLKTACKQNKLWQDQGFPFLKMAVNLSARQFQHEDIVKTVSNILTETGLDPIWLELEITESTIMKYADETVKTLQQLEEMGVSVSIDDFGTGYSSLSYLKLFPIKSLKIDRSFIKDIDKSYGDLAIAKSVITLGHALNFEVVAEGVENQTHLEILRNERCDVSQGFYYSPPVPSEIFETMMQEKKSREQMHLTPPYEKLSS